MVDKTPIYVDIDADSGQPTNLASFSEGDVVPQEFGGTGGTSLSGTLGLTFNKDSGTLTTTDDVTTVSFVGGSETLAARNIHVTNTLSGTDSLTTVLDTSASISGCPFPPPFSYLAAGADLGTGVDNFYFGSGVSVAETTMGTDGITFDSTNGYWDITEAGWYDVRGDIAQNVTVSPTTVTNYVLVTTGYGGVESIKSQSTTVLRTNIDPHLTSVHWMGYLLAGIKLAIKCDASAGNMKSERGSTASVRRIG